MKGAVAIALFVIEETLVATRLHNNAPFAQKDIGVVPMRLLNAQHAQLESTQNQHNKLLMSASYVRQVNTIRIPDQTNQKIVIIAQ